MYVEKRNSCEDITSKFDLNSNQHSSDTLFNDETEKTRSNKIQSVSDSFNEIYSKYSTSLLLESKGNIARDHLANERTYLAWFRTSLSFVTIGIGIVQLYSMSNIEHAIVGKIIGLCFIITSMLFLFMGMIRYFHIQSALRCGNFPASRAIISSASFCILILFVAVFIILILEP